MENEFDRYYIKIRTILGIDPKTIHEELTTALGPMLHHIQQLQDGQSVSVKGEKMSMMNLDLVVQYPNLQIQILNWYDRLSTTIHIQLMMIL